MNGRISDPTFTGLRSTLPFGWSLRINGDVRATSGQFGKPGLTIRAATGQGGMVAEQTTMLPPGRYQMAAKSIMASSDIQAGIILSFGCEGQPSDTRLALTARRGALAVDRADIVVPRRGCAAQRLRVVVLPSEDPAGIDATLQEIRIDSLPAIGDTIRRTEERRR